VFNFVVELLEESTGSYNSDVVYNGTGTSCIVSNLKPQVTYEVDIYYYVGDVLHAFSSKNFSTSSSSDSHSTPIIADGSKNGTSTGIIAGLVVGLFLGILLIALLVFFLIIKKKKKKPIEFDYGAPTGAKRRATFGLASIGTGYSLRDLRSTITSSSSSQGSTSVVSSDESQTSSLRETQEIGPPPPEDANSILLEPINSSRE